MIYKPENASDVLKIEYFITCPYCGEIMKDLLRREFSWDQEDNFFKCDKCCKRFLNEGELLKKMHDFAHFINKYAKDYKIHKSQIGKKICI